MAGKVSKKNSSRLPVTNEDVKKIFVDRATQSTAFKESLNDISDEGSSYLFYAGAGGVGKTALFMEFINFLTTTTAGLKFKHVAYDFSNGAEMIVALNALKKFLSEKYNVEFPLYEKGCVYHYQKLGDIAFSNVKIQETLNESFIVKEAKKHLNSVIGHSGDVQTIGRAAEILMGISIDVLNELGNTSTMLRASKIIFDKWIKYRAEKAKRNDDGSYGELISNLEKRKNAPQVDAVKEFLPELFARDLSDWLNETKSNLIIFLDTYETLTEDEKNIKRHEKLVSINHDVPADWWVEKLIEGTSRVLWVIAGRSEIKKIGEEIPVTKGEGLFSLKALENNFADEFLTKSGITDSNLRAGLVELTGGYPNFLNACVDTYKNIIDKGNLPRISDFGKKREDTITRLLGYMDEGAGQMVRRLAILGMWTDDVAAKILANLNEYNAQTYIRVKKLSFISAQSEKVFIFDRSIQKILIDDCKENSAFSILLTQTRDAANNFFRSGFENQHFKIWYEIILRTTAAADLTTQYKENLAPITSRFDDSVIETVLNEFCENIKSELGTENISYGYFEHLLAEIKLRQDKVKDALELAESAYKKFEDNHSVEKISVTDTLANVYKELKRTADEINLREKSVIESEKLFRDKADEHIIKAKENLAAALERGDKKNQALEVRAEIFHALEHFNDERTMKAADNYVDALIVVNRFNKALMYMEKCVNLCRSINDTSKLIIALDKITWILSKFSNTEYHRRELSFRRELIDLCENVEDNYSQKIIYTFNYVTYAIKYIGRCVKTTQALKKLEMKFRTHLELSTDDEKRVELMQQLETILNWSDRPEEAARFSMQIKQLIRKIIDDKTTAPIKDYDAVISALNSILEKIYFTADYQLILKIYQKILHLIENKVGARDYEIISAMEKLAGILECSPEGYIEAIKLRERAFAMLKGSGADAKKLLQAMYKVAGSYRRHHSENYSEILNWGKRILNYCRENFLSDAPEVIDAMDHLSGIYEEMRDYVKAENLRTKIAAIKESKRGDKFNSDVIVAEVDVADRLHDAGKYAEELVIRKEIVDLYRKNSEYNARLNLGRNGNMMVRAMDSVVQLLEKLGHDKDANRVRKNIVVELKEDYDAIVEEFGSDSEYALFKLNDIANALRNIGDFDEEFKYRKKIVELRQAVDKNSEDTILALEKLADFFSDHDKEYDEFKIREQIAEMRKNILDKFISLYGKDNDDTISAMRYFADAEKNLNRDEEVAHWRDEILSAQRRIAEKSDLTLGKNSPQAIKTWNYLAVELKWAKNYDAALIIFRDILARLKEIYPDGNEKILSQMGSICENLGRQGNYPAALNVLQEILQTSCAEKNGEFSWNTLYIADDIARVFEILNDYCSALQVRREIVELYRKKFSNDECNSGTIREMEDVTSVLSEMGNYAQALAEQKKIVELLKGKYNEDDSIVRNAMEKLAELLEESGDLDGALNQRLEIYNICEKNFGVDNEEFTIPAMNDVAEILEKQGNHIDALTWRRKVVDFYTEKLEKTIDAYGENSDKTVEKLEELVHALSKANLSEYEIKNRERLVKILTDFKGKCAEKTLAAMDDLSKLYAQINLDEKARKVREDIAAIQQEILDSRLEQFGNEHKRTLDIREKLASTFEQLGQVDVAKNLREENLKARENIIKRRKERFTESHEITLDAMRDLAKNFEELNRYDDAEKIYRRIVKIYEGKFADDKTNLKIIDAMESLVSVLQNKEDYDAAIDEQKKLIGLLKEKYRRFKFCGYVVDALNTLSNIYESANNFDAAIEIGLEIIDLLKIRYGGNENHSKIVRAKEEISRLRTVCNENFQGELKIESNGTFKRRA